MGSTIDTFKTAHQTVTSLLELVDSSKGEQRTQTLSSLKEAVLAHIEEENRVIHEAMGNPDADGAFKVSAQNFLDELGNIAQAALLPFFDKYSSSDVVDSKEFNGDFSGIKGALSDRISFEEEAFYPELEKLAY